MSKKIRSIDFGEIDHSLYERITDVCDAFGYNSTEFIEQAFFIWAELIDGRGVSCFEILEKEYDRDKEILESNRNAPKHPFEVRDIHEEVYLSLSFIKTRNFFPWIVILRVLLMVMELEIEKIGKTSNEEGLTNEDMEQIMEKYFDKIGISPQMTRKE